MNTTSPKQPKAKHAEWQNYADLLAAAHEAHRFEIRELIGKLPWNGIRRALDASSGDGFYTELIGERLDADGEIIGVDIDEEALASLERRRVNFKGNASISSCRADVFDLPFEDESIDFVFCAQSLISLASPRKSLPDSGILAAFAEFRREPMPAVLE